MPEPQAHRLTAWLVFVLILGGYLLLLAGFPFAYVWATYEDLYGEWSQVYLYLAVAVLSGWLALRPAPWRALHLLLALLFFYGAGEEISWGQRLFGFGTPEVFDEYNLQGETNLHNFLTGPVTTWTNDVMEYAVAGALVGYGLVYPLLLRLGWPLACWVRRMGLAAPGLHLWPFFVTAAVFELGRFHFNEAEIAEILVGTAMMFMVAGHVLELRAQPQAVDGPLTDNQARRLARNMALLAAGVAGLAVTTTQVIYRIPAQRAVIDQRVLNGYEKFGRRYQEEDLALWARAAAFYAKAYEAQPQRTDLLQELVSCLQMAGDDERYRHYARRLLERTLTRAQMASRNPAQQLALANTYREIGDVAQAERHLQLALERAIEEAELLPADPEAAYTLGMVYENRADYRMAREQYRRARTLNPAEPKYTSGYERVDAYLKKAP